MNSTLSFWATEKGSQSHYKQMYLQTVKGIESKGFVFGLTLLQIFILTKSFGINNRLCKKNVSLSLSPLLINILGFLTLWFQIHRGIRFYVDDVPIRVFKNNTIIGVSYPSRPMQIVASLWNGDSWATDGGQTKTNWSHAPFQAHFQGFDISACTVQTSNIQPCYSPKYWWNMQKYWKLNPTQQRAYENVKKNYVNYDYCSDRPRFPIPPPECPQ